MNGHIIETAWSRPGLANLSKGACPNCPRFSKKLNFKEILSGANGNFQEQNNVLESPTIIIINAYYNYVINV